MSNINTDPQINQNIEEKLEKISSSLNAISKSLENINELGYIWSQSTILEFLPHVFKSPIQLKAYMLSDGNRSTRDISRFLKKVSHQTINNWWDTWSTKFGIVEQNKVNGPFRKLYSLSDLFMVFGNHNKDINDEQTNG